jgi:hypothetical protein
VATCVISATATNLIPRTEPRTEPKDNSERSLVLRAQDGDQEAFATLFQLHKKRVYSVCLQMTKDVADAEDLTQEAFLQVFRRLGLLHLVVPYCGQHCAHEVATPQVAPGTVAR